MRQTEQNNGGRYRSLVDMTWADGWLAEADVTRESIAGDADLEDSVERIDGAERTYYLCEPAAREIADRDHTMRGDWGTLPQWYEEHAEAARAAQAELDELAEAER